MNAFSADRLLFTGKTVAAVILTLFLAIRCDLQQPAWAVLGVLLVTLQPVMFSGGTPPLGVMVARGIARLAGTLIGCIAGIVLVALFSQQPMLYLIGAGTWLALCTYGVMLQQDEPASYALMLSGYTATLTSLSALGHDPQQIFTLAVARGSETALGICVALLVNIAVRPRFGSKRLPYALADFLNEAAQEALCTFAVERNAGDLPSRFAQLSARHAQLEQARGLVRLESWDFHRQMPALERFASDSLALLSGLRELEAALARLRQRRDGAALAERLAAEAWPMLKALACVHTDAPRTANTLQQLAPFDWAALATQGFAPEPPSRVRAEVVRQRLNEVLGLLQHGQRLLAALHDPQLVRELPRGRVRLASHHEHKVARYNALRVFVAFNLFGLFWVHSGWPSGYFAMMMLGMFTVLFAKAPNPAQMAHNFFIGTLLSIPVSALYVFVILPAIDGFWPMALAIGAAFAAISLMMPHPRLATSVLPGAMNFMMTISLKHQYVLAPTAFINSSLAALLGTGAATLTFMLLRQRPARERVASLLRAYWRGIRRLTQEPSLPNRGRFESRLHDRLGRLVALNSDTTTLNDALYLHALALCLWRIRRQLPALGDYRAAIEAWLAELGEALAQRARNGSAVLGGGQRHIGQAERWVSTLYRTAGVPEVVIGEYEMLAYLLQAGHRRNWIVEGAP